MNYDDCFFFFFFCHLYVLSFLRWYMYVFRSCLCLVIVISCAFETTFKELAASSKTSAYGYLASRHFLPCNTYLVQIVIVYSMVNMC